MPNFVVALLCLLVSTLPTYAQMQDIDSEEDDPATMTADNPEGLTQEDLFQLVQWGRWTCRARPWSGGPVFTGRDSNANVARRVALRNCGRRWGNRCQARCSR